MSEDEWNDTADFFPSTRVQPKQQFKKNGLNKFSACSHCGKTGHIARFCPTPKGNNGHRRPSDQAEIWGSGAMQTRNPGKDNFIGFKNGCFKCGKEDHWSRECPENQFGRSGRNYGASSQFPSKNNRFNQNDGCFKCGQDGHWADECPRGCDKFKKDQGNKPVNAEIYVPAEILDETLFDNGVESGLNFDKIKEIPVEVTGEDAPGPIDGFEECELRTILHKNVRKAHYTEPTPVQRYAIPIIMQGRDMMACAQTGSGKTAAFLLPIIHKLLEEEIEPHMGIPQTPEVIIITPTRELAIQITKEGKKFAYQTTIGVMSLYGGASVSYQFDQLREQNINIVVATPGRLSQSIRDGRLSLKQLKFLVLDEADRMLDMGFQSDIDEIVMHPMMPLKTRRQTLMFSATFPDDIQLAAKTYLKKTYLFLKVGIIGGACTDVEQTFHQVSAFEKRDKLVEILQRNQIAPGRTEKTLIFVGKKTTADFLASYLSQENFSATSIHADRYQRQREEAVRDFAKNKRTILVATSVAARGLDIPKVQHVINYDLPQSVDEYVHRIGRTGRVGNAGKATSFYDVNATWDQALTRPLVRILTQAQQRVPEWLRQEGEIAVGRSLTSHYGGHFGMPSSDIRRANEERRKPLFEDDDDDWD